MIRVMETPRARYRQVADDMREAIKRGTYAPGEALPSQPELARRYGLNQTSINRAIALLRAEGLIRVEHGRGAFVQEVPRVKRTRRVPQTGGSGSSFADEMRQAGLEPRTQLVSVTTEPAPEGVAERLAIPKGDPVVVRLRHMFASDRPVQLAASYLPVSVAGSEQIALPDVGPRGLYKRLAERGYDVDRFVEEIEARRPRPNEAEFLGLTEAQHVLEVARIAYAGHIPVETVINVFPSQQWRLAYEWPASRDG